MKKPKRLFDFLEYQLENPLDKSINTKYNGKWESLSTNHFYEKVQIISRKLIEIGVKKGDKIALISTQNRTEWCIADNSVLQIGAVTVPIYPTISKNEFQYVLNHSESKICFVSDKDIFDKVNQIKNKTKLEKIYSFEEFKNCPNWNLLFKNDNKSLKGQVILRMNNVLPDDLATIIYTSGTTGVPKGVMLTHRNIVSNILSASKRLPPMEKKNKALSFLPLCHIFERIIIYMYYYSRVEIYFAESLETISENLKEVKPFYMTAVPRLIEKIFDKIESKAEEFIGIKKSLYKWSISIADRFSIEKQNGIFYNLKLEIAKFLVFSKWKSALGGRLELICSGSAPLQPRLAKIFTAAGIQIMEGYGLTETSPVISISEAKKGGTKFGYVGKVIEGIEVKIAKDGEILCKGPNVMKGYFKDSKLTSKTIKNGFLHTGDIGEIDNEGFLKITDRKKQLFKTSGGKYIAPQVIENRMKRSPFIEQIMVIGEGEKMPSALIQPDFDYIKNWLTKNKINTLYDFKNICKNKELLVKIEEEVEKINKEFGDWERIKKFELTPEIWSIQNGLLTPTMKLRRKSILKKFIYLKERIYT
ncbi:MAG: long-chain fatty acid--CoA ligase [Gammaproteobacteria bacterium]|nr:long-chain fatty acid--CoA ligase [Gammaproteobacteria bacterium]